MVDVKSMSLRASAWLYECDAEWEPDGNYGAIVWEPLNLPALTGRPSVRLGNTVSLYDVTGNKKLGETQHHGMMLPFPMLLRLSNGHWYEVASGRMERREDDRWYMRWWVFRNTRTAKWLEDRNRELQGSNPEEGK